MADEANPHFIGRFSPPKYQVYRGLHSYGRVLSAVVDPVGPDSGPSIQVIVFTPPRAARAGLALHYRFHGNADLGAAPPIAEEANQHFIGRFLGTKLKWYNNARFEYLSVPAAPDPPLPPPTLGDRHPFPAIPFGAQERAIGEVYSGISRGKMNCVGDVTLTADASSTTITDPRIAATSHIWLVPMTANAAAALTNAAGTYVSSRGNETAVITHANNAQTDRTFTYVIIG